MKRALVALLIGSACGGPVAKQAGDPCHPLGQIVCEGGRWLQCMHIGRDAKPLPYDQWVDASPDGCEDAP